jgi:hypothetical protein
MRGSAALVEQIGDPEMAYFGTLMSDIGSAGLHTDCRISGTGLS